MPLIDITNPAVIKFLVENYEKTSRLTLKWKTLHHDKLLAAATLTRDEKSYYESDVTRHLMEEGMATITRDHIVSGFNRRKIPLRDGTRIPCVADFRKDHSVIDIELGDPKEDPRLSRPDSDLSPDPVMRPIDQREKDILYNDIPFYGRQVYLKSRFQKAPEDKFYFVESSAWEYGWRLKDSYFSKNSPKCGKVCRVTRGDKSRTGPQPDPPHYQSPDFSVSTKCS